MSDEEEKKCAANLQARNDRLPLAAETVALDDHVVQRVQRQHLRLPIGHERVDDLEELGDGGLVGFLGGVVVVDLLHHFGDEEEDRLDQARKRRVALELAHRFGQKRLD